MAEGDDLPDADYASIYGHEALDARREARMQQLEADCAVLVARMKERIEQEETHG